MQNRKKLLLILAVAFITMIFLSVFTALRSSSAPKKVRDDFLSGVLAGEVESTYQLLAKPTKESKPQELWQITVTRVNAYLGESQPELLEEESFKLTDTQDAYRAAYEATGTDGDYTISMVLVKEAEGWRVQVFNTALK